MTTTYHLSHSPKSLRETLCVAEMLLNQNGYPDRAAMIGDLIKECDRKRPLAPDGKHTGRRLCTIECGCPLPRSWPA